MDGSQGQCHTELYFLVHLKEILKKKLLSVSLSFQ
jgi:hypothetical protein